LTQGAILRDSRTKYKRSKNVFAVTSVALSFGHIWARLLQPLAAVAIWYCHVHPKNLVEMWIICLDPVSANFEKASHLGAIATASLIGSHGTNPVTHESGQVHESQIFDW